MGLEFHFLEMILSYSKKTIRYNRPTLPCIIYKSDGQSVELSHVTKTQNYKETKQTYKIDEQ